MTAPRLLHFTLAELAFLAHASQTTAGAITEDKLLVGETATAALLESGSGGLRLRDWVTSSGDDVTPNPVLAGIADVFGSAVQWIELALERGDDASSALLITGERLAVIIRPLETGVFHVAALEPSTSADSLAQVMIGAFLQVDEPGTVTVTVSTAQDSRTAAARCIDGDWSFRDSETESASLTADSLDAAAAGAVFRRWWSIPAGLASTAH